MLFVLWCRLFGHKWYVWSHDLNQTTSYLTTWIKLPRDYCERCGVAHPRLGLEKTDG